MNTLAKLNEILLDLREIKHPQIEHQAKKLEKVIEQLGWQPIASAPKDGSAFFTYIPWEELDDCDPEDHYDIAGWDLENGEFWKTKCGFDLVTQWKPLPEPPDPDITPNVHGTGTGRGHGND